MTPAPETTLRLLRGSKDRDRVRGYLEHNLGCSRKEVIGALCLHPRTVAKAIAKIRTSNMQGVAT